MGLLRKPVGWWGNRDKEEKCATSPPVLLISAQTGAGMTELFDTIKSYRNWATESGYLVEKRRKQAQYWMWKYLKERLLETTQQDKRVKKKALEIQHSLDEGLLSPRSAANTLWRSIVGSANDMG